MLLTITTTNEPATDIGYLLHKHPSRVQSFELAFGQAHVFYPEAQRERCTAALLLDVDPVKLSRRSGQDRRGYVLMPYVNDRPYVASSFLSVALAKVFGSALAGKCKEREDLADVKLPLEARIAVLPCRGGDEVLRRLFEPLGYAVEVQSHPLDEKFPEWGKSSYYTVELRAIVRLQDLLSHLYVLIPVLDDDKHYWVGEDEVEKLFRFGGDWLAAHPEREMIAKRYLKHQRGLTRAALDRLAEEDSPDPDVENSKSENEFLLEKRINLNELRLQAVTGELKQSGARRILDLGCGEGRLIRLLLEEKNFDEILGVDVSSRALKIALNRLNLDQLAPMQKERVKLIHGTLVYRDRRLSGYDAAAVVEVIEHLDQARLATFERVLFEFARPKTVVLTTPNFEYNAVFGELAGGLRHRDHRFEWTREQFREWANRVADQYNYSTRFLSVGPEDEKYGASTQMAVFGVNE